MKTVLKIKLLGLVIVLSMGMLTLSTAQGQQTFSSAYEQDLEPMMPENLNATALYSNLVRLTWTDKSHNEEGFHIYVRDKYRNQYRLLYDVPANKTYAYIWELSPQTQYHFYVEAFNSHGNSAHSNIAVTTTPYSYIHGSPEAPTDLEIIAQGQTEVEIQWQDNSNNEEGFKIARMIKGSGYYEIIDSVQSDVLTYREVGLEPDNIYIYKVCAFNDYGFSAYTNEVFVTTQGNGSILPESELPLKEFILRENYPNPFNPSTTINFILPEASDVKLSIYNTLGQRVALLANSFFESGSYSFQWDASGLNSGIYFYRLEAGNFTQIRKMILIK